MAIQHVGAATDYGSVPLDITVHQRAKGHTLIVAIAQTLTPSGTVSITDSRGNTYSIDADETVGSGSSAVRAVVGSAYLETALLTGDVVTISLTGGSGGLFVAIEEFTGLDISGPDQAAESGVATQGPDWGTATTNATTNDYELVFALAYAYSSTPVPGGEILTPAGYTYLRTLPTNLAARQAKDFYKVVTSSGPQSAVFDTLANAGPKIGVVSTYRGVPSVMPSTLTYPSGKDPGSEGCGGSGYGGPSVAMVNGDLQVYS